MSEYKLIGGEVREYKLGMREYESVEAVCDKCGMESHNLGHYPDLKVGDSPWTCNCGGNMVVTQVETCLYSKYNLVKCSLCGKTAIASINTIGSNVGWICPVCGPDGHNGSQGFRDFQSIYYNPKQLTDIEFLFKEGQTSLEAVFG